MSGTSRIGGQRGYSGLGGRSGSGRSAALARFCKGRKKGEVVAGVFLRLETDSLGWALLENEELLAHLPEEGPRPQPGEKVFFRIEALTPEVVLKLLSGTDPSARLSSLLPPLPLGQETVLYVAARDRFDTLLTAKGGLGAQRDFASRRRFFIEKVATDSMLFSAFAEVRGRSRTLFRVASSAGLVFFQHMPWLSDRVSGVEVSLWSSGETPIFANATLPSGDKLLLRGIVEAGKFMYRLEAVPFAKNGGEIFPRGIAANGRLSECRSAVAHSRGNNAPQTADLVGRILALAADSGSMPVNRFSRKL